MTTRKGSAVPPPQELLRTLVDVEIDSRYASMPSIWMKVASFPVVKTLEELDIVDFSIPPSSFAYLAPLEKITAKNLALMGPVVAGRWKL